jgi:ankyrin repeat protein
MRTWEGYKDTFNLSEDIFALARCGDPHNLYEFLNSGMEININQKNHKGYSPLMISVYNGNYETSELLLERGADPNSSDHSGNTILMGAAFKGDVELIKLLINRGAQKELKNLDGLTAEQWASAFGRHNVLSILKPDINYSTFQNMMNAIKVIWSLLKPKTKKEVPA